MVKLVQENINQLEAICKANKVAKLYLFGSALTSKFNDQSDFDFAVLFSESLTPLEHGQAFFTLKDDLENLFNHEVDLLSYRVLKNPIFKEELDKTKVTLYAA